MQVCSASDTGAAVAYFNSLCPSAAPLAPGNHEIYASCFQNDSPRMQTDQTFASGVRFHFPREPLLSGRPGRPLEYRHRHFHLFNHQRLHSTG
jgi:hypothetical protein